MPRPPFAAQSWRIVSLVGAAHTMSHVYNFSLWPVFYLIAPDLGVSYTALGLIVTAASVATTLGQVPVGFLVDRVGGRRVLIAGLAVQASAIGLIGFSQSYWSLLALFTVAGIAHSVYHPADYAILSRTVPEGRLGRAYTLHSFGGNLGTAATPMTMIALAALADWRTAFLAIGAVGLILALALIPFRALLDPGETADARAPGRTDTGGWREGVGVLLSAPILLCFMFFVIVTMSANGIRAFAPTALVEMRAMPLAAANGAVTGFILGGAAGILAGGVVADRFGARSLTAFVGLAGAGAVLLLVGSVSLPVVLLAGALTFAGFLRGIVQGTRDLMVYAATPAGAHGKVFGFVSTGGHVGMAVMPVVFGGIMDAGRPELAFTVAGLLALAAVATFAAVRSRAPHPA